jgi:hypothetical protein
LKRGSILFHTHFEYTNGDIGEKLLIVLNDPDPAREPYLLCRVTSREKGKLRTFGCQEDLSLFFLPAGHDFFEKDTWVQLYEIFEAEWGTLVKDHLAGALNVLGELDQLTIQQLMNCIKRIKDISRKHRKMILGKR